MANKVTLKRSSVAGKIPQTSDLDFGEVALNFTDGRLYFRNSNDQIEFFETPSDSSGLSVLNNDLSLGFVTGSVTQSLDLISVDESANDSYDLGNIVISGVIFPDLFSVPSHPVDNLPSPSIVGRLIYIDRQDEYIEEGYVEDGYAPEGGESANDSIAFSDGTNWVEISNDYNDLTNTPTLSAVATSGSYNDLSNTPALSTVATSGSYNDLSNVPDLSQYATETYVNTAVSNLVDSAPATLDTLNELAEALDSDPNFATTVTNELSLKVDSSSLAVVATSGNYNDLANTPDPGIQTGKAIAMSIVFG